MKKNEARIDRQELEVEDAAKKEEFATMKEGTFTITVKDDEKKELYKNDEEPFKYPEIEEGNLVNALRYFGAKLSDDAISFISTALEGAETGKAVAKVVKIVNGYLYDSYKGNQYAKVLNDKRPLSEESILNSQARMVRDFMRQANVDAESAIQTLSQFVPTMKEYTIEMFNANKGRV